MENWSDPGLWGKVVGRMRNHFDAGLAAVLTEDSLRLATAQAIVDFGVASEDLRVEWPHPALPGSRIDLIVGHPKPRTLIEFKYPREPNEKNAAWTMVLGEVLKDFYRLASFPGDVARLFVYLEGDRLRSYMAGAGMRFGLVLDADRVVLHPDNAALLPSTAAQIIGTELAARHVTATRVFQSDLFGGARLHVYVVDPIVGNVVAAEAVSSVMAAPIANFPPVERTTARTEILDAARAVLCRSGRSSFSLQDILVEMSRRSTRYADSTIRTMVTSHMCATAPDHAAVTYSDFERLDRGEYRMFSD